MRVGFLCCWAFGGIYLLLILLLNKQYSYVIRYAIKFIYKKILIAMIANNIKINQYYSPSNLCSLVVSYSSFSLIISSIYYLTLFFSLVSNQLSTITFKCGPSLIKAFSTTSYKA